ncbi:type II secretion system protein [bacterium]|nr:type II secretion system protein [bacterium]
MTQKQKGFTLIELLAVIAIIGILAGLVLVATGRAKKQARDAQRKSIVRSIAEAEEAYYNDHGSYANLQTLYHEGYLSVDIAGGKAPVGPASCRNGEYPPQQWNLSWYFALKSNQQEYAVMTGLAATSSQNDSFVCTSLGRCRFERDKGQGAKQ